MNDLKHYKILKFIIYNFRQDEGINLNYSCKYLEKTGIAFRRCLSKMKAASRFNEINLNGDSKIDLSSSFEIG